MKVFTKKQHLEIKRLNKACPVRFVLGFFFMKMLPVQWYMSYPTVHDLSEVHEYLALHGLSEVAWVIHL